MRWGERGVGGHGKRVMEGINEGVPRWGKENGDQYGCATKGRFWEGYKVLE